MSANIIIQEALRSQNAAPPQIVTTTVAVGQVDLDSSSILEEQEMADAATPHHQAWLIISLLTNTHNNRRDLATRAHVVSIPSGQDPIDSIFHQMTTNKMRVW